MDRNTETPGEGRVTPDDYRASVLADLQAKVARAHDALRYAEGYPPLPLYAIEAAGEIRQLNGGAGDDLVMHQAIEAKIRDAVHAGELPRIAGDGPVQVERVDLLRWHYAHAVHDLRVLFPEVTAP